MAAIDLEGVTKVYPDGTEAVSAFDLAIADGEFVVLVGPSGCGKTSVLRMVAGLEEISAGVVRIGGRTVNHLLPKDRDIAMVFQNYALYPHMTVFANMAFGLRQRKTPKAEIARRVNAAARTLGLADALDKKPRTLSGGQRQRVAMGRAIVREPQAFLMDEPLSNLDASLRVQMRSEVLRIQRRLGVAALYVTHDQTEAMTMGDRVAVLRGGLLQQVAAPQELYERPANLFVASFIGSPAMNLYEATISGPGDRLVLSLGSQQLVLPTDLARRRPALGAAEGRKLVVGIRPECLTPAASAGDAETARDRTISVRAELVESLGNESLLHFSTDARMVLNRGGVWTADVAVDASADIAGAAATEGVARIDPRVPITVGDQLTLAVDVDRLHFFDAETGEAVRAGGASPVAPVRAGQS